MFRCSFCVFLILLLLYKQECSTHCVVFRSGSQQIDNCAEEQAYVPRFLTLLSDQFECIEETVVEEVMEVVEETMDDLFDMLRENAPAAAAAGGTVAAGALVAMPPLPMVAAGGAPPGTVPNESYHF